MEILLIFMMLRKIHKHVNAVSGVSRVHFKAVDSLWTWVRKPHVRKESNVKGGGGP